jgi:hypothetical protein
MLARWNQGKTVKILASIVLVLIFSPVTGYTRGYETTKKVGTYEMEVSIDKNPLVLGENQIEIKIKEAGKTIKDASVWVNYYMPPMPRMSPMNYKTEAKLKSDKYKATMNIIMSGPWIIVIKMAFDGKTYTTKLNIEAQ